MPKANYGAGASGALSGAATGASMGGPWGALAGGVIGGVAGLFGGGKKKKKRSTFDKQQKNLYNLEHQGILGQGPLADLYNYDPQRANQVFSQNYAQPAYRDFEEGLLPKLTGQFRNQGLMQSSYAGDAISKLARDVQENLNAQRTKYLYDQEQSSNQSRMNAINNIQGRSTFAYDKAAPTGFNMADITKSITPEMIDSAKSWFK